MTPALFALMLFAQPPEVPRLAVGLTIGEPNGLSVAAPVGELFAVHLAAGFSPSDERDALATFDVVYALDDVIGAVFASGWMTPWFGVGARYADVDDAADSNAFGVRVPFGVSYYDKSGSIELFSSVAWGVVLIPEREASVEFAFGLRFGL